MTIRCFSTILFVLLSVTACGSDPTLPPVERDLIGTLKTRPSLTKFTEALETTGVAATLQKEGSYTIFAPMDVAVSGTLDQATVRHHILAERVTFSKLAGETTSYTTLHTDEIEIEATGAIRVGDALMVELDIAADNGVIHVIDKVLTPGDVPTSLTPDLPINLIQPAADDTPVNPATPAQ